MNEVNDQFTSDDKDVVFWLAVCDNVSNANKLGDTDMNNDYEYALFNEDSDLWYEEFGSDEEADNGSDVVEGWALLTHSVSLQQSCRSTSASFVFNPCASN